MKIMNMIKRCLISLFLINFSFLLSAVKFTVGKKDVVNVDLNVDTKEATLELNGLNATIVLNNGGNKTVYLKNIKINEGSQYDTYEYKLYNEGTAHSISIKSGNWVTVDKTNVEKLKFLKNGKIGNELLLVNHSIRDSIYNKLNEQINKSKKEAESKELKGTETKPNEIKEENNKEPENKGSELNEPRRETIILDKEVVSKEEIVLKSITNNSDYDVYYNIIDENKNGTGDKLLEKGKTVQIDKKIRRIYVKKNKKDEEIYIWKVEDSKKEWAKNHKEVGADKITNTKQEEKTKVKEKISTQDLISKIKSDLTEDEYWSEYSINKIDSMYNYVNCNIGNAKDKKKFVEDNKLDKYLNNEVKKFNANCENIDKKVKDLISKYSKSFEIKNEDECEKEIKRILEAKQDERRKILSKFGELIDSKFEFSTESPIVTIVVIVLIVIILIVCLTILSKKKKSRREEPINQPVSTIDSTPNIVVRKTSTSILKKQSLDDVINDNSYYKIESVDFCDDSAVRRIYIKNTCVKGIYNMYAEDLRNPNNPKEDGCMVLGRWIYDEQANEYCVSLEEIVEPGDDAVFQEYELNFGGKIKLKVAEKLRKLRKESNLQYDLTCWVHSHPGLGVFFSNSDSSVQMQLKHSTHPNFLTAIVVDILTPEQEFGIFTFKRDSSINSRNDLKKMYSLEELYKWAVESERNSYKPEDHYNVLSKAKTVSEECSKIMLSNGAIIDISSIVTEQNSGLVGLIYGYKAQTTIKKEYVITSVTNNDATTENELLGCLIIGTHCSIPSIRKAVSNNIDKIKFVMFYSIKEETITTIPIIEQQMSMDEKYYSEEKIENLKIWTRRKR